MKMNPLLATAVGVAVVAGIATWFYLAIGTILIWAGFVAWACFFALGGDTAALKSTIFCNAFGVVVASLTSMAILAVPLGEVLTSPLWIGICVAVSVFIYILLSKIPLFSSVPATTLGYAATFAFLVQTPGKFDLAALTSLSFNNSLVIVPVSMFLGALFGFLSGKLAGALTAK